MYRTTALLALCGLLCSSPLHARQRPPFSAMDVFALEWVSDPQIAPDGKRVAYVRNGMDIMLDERRSAIWLISADGADHEKLTNRELSESSPAWSPDGTRLAFIGATPQGAEIFVVWLYSGKISRLTQLDRSPQELSWSPDGSTIAFSMLVPEKPPVLVKGPDKPRDAVWAEDPRITTRVKYESDGSGYIEPGFMHFFVVPATGGTARQLTSGEFHHRGQPQWAADGNSLFFSANRNPDWELNYLDTEIYRLDVSNGDLTALTDRKGPDSNPLVSANGKQIAYTGYDDRVQTYQVNRLYLMNVDGSDKREINIGLDRNISGLAWNGSNDGLYFQYNHHGNTRIGFSDLSGRTRVVAENLGGTTIGRPYGGGSFSISKQGRIAFTYATPSHPAELAVTGIRKQPPRVLTGLNADVLPFRSLGQVRSVWYKSSFDGRDLQGYVVTPPGYDETRTYPLIVENHGGPISNYGPWFSAELQLYAAAGYVVFYPNPRGSTSYGEAFGNLLFNNYPGEDYQDVMDGVDMMIDKGYTREDQLYVTGGSAGGIMTVWMVGKNKRFRAAVVAKPVMNWVSKTLTADNYFMYADYRYPGQPWENFENYMKFSPLSLVGNIETPTMVMVGTADMRTPLSEAKQLYGALKIRGIDTALVEFPDAYHTIVKRPSQMIAKAQHVLAWFEKYSRANDAAGSVEKDE